LRSIRARGSCRARDKTLNLVAALRQSPAGPLSAGFEQRNALNQNVFQ
jgi:hypothetical protein